MKVTFTKADEGRSVVYDRADGSSVSARIVWVTRWRLQIRLAVPDSSGAIRTPVIPRKNWNRLTLFSKNSLFLVT